MAKKKRTLTDPPTPGWYVVRDADGKRWWWDDGQGWWGPEWMAARYATERAAIRAAEGIEDQQGVSVIEIVQQGGAA